MDAFILSRMQFAANITFHILFPSITIAMGWILLFFKVRYSRSDDMKWMNAYRFWVKVFALCFALGVVSGITMSFQFGTNWPGYMQKVGNIAGPLLAYEVLTAFFMEATFLGIMLFGFNRVSNRVHTIATILVAAGTTLSAFWILVLNSWMQTPAGFEIREDGKAYATSWLHIVFNPSMPYRLTHMLIASGLTASFMIAGVSAYRYLRHDKSPSVIAAMKTGIYLAAFLIPVQIIVGDAHGLNTLKHQPAKIAAIEAIWATEKKVPLLLFGIPNLKEQKNGYSVSIPSGASLILTHKLSGEIKGLNEFKDHPSVMPLFFSFRIMVITGMLMFLVSWCAAWQIRREGVPRKWLLKIMAYMTFSGWIAVVAGWYTTEMGRQPWLVYGVLKTADARATNVSGNMIGLSFAMYLTLYVILISSFIKVVFYMARKAEEAKPKLDTKAFSSAAIAEVADKEGS